MKVLGITDAVNTCDCCGKTGLARTVALEPECGTVVHYGTTCASKKHLGKTLPQIRRQAQLEKESEIDRLKSKVFDLPEFERWEFKFNEGKRLGLRGKAFSDHHQEAFLAKIKAIEELVRKETNVLGIHHSDFWRP